MIVLDENLDEQRVTKAIAAHYRGAVLSIRELRRLSVIKDDAIPAVLGQYRRATFITTNVADFWRRVAAHQRYCIVCVPLPNERQQELPSLIRSLLQHKVFGTVRGRLGTVIRLTHSEIQFYRASHRQIERLPW